MGTTAELIAEVSNIEHAGVNVYTTWPSIMVAQPPLDRAMSQEHRALICSTRQNFHPCVFCDDLGINGLKIQPTQWVSAISRSEFAYKETLVKLNAFRMFTANAICVMGPLGDAELEQAALAQGAVSKTIAEITGKSFPIFFGSNTPGVIHPQCMKNVWTARGSVILRPFGKAEIQ